MKTQTFLRRVLGGLYTLGIVAMSVALVVFGVVVLNVRANSNPDPESAPVTPVSTSPAEITPGYYLERRFIGQVEAGASAVISFELGGRLTHLNVVEGQTITQNQKIGQLDTALLDAEKDRLNAAREATDAQLKLARSRLNRAVKLKREGFATQAEIDSAIAARNELQNRLAESDAALSGLDVRLEKSTLYAPFAGRVGSKNVDGGETVSAGQAIITLIKESAPQIRVGLPLNLDTESISKARIQVGAEQYDVTLSSIRPDIDPTTRTRTALFNVSQDAPLLFGQTATLVTKTFEPQPGTWLPIDALQEGAGGTWNVLVVKDDIVRIASTEILHIETDRAFVRGSFEAGDLLINTGAHRVVVGQTVNAQSDALAQ